ncbi:nitrite extrusion protein 2 [Escherichia coli]|uniref:Nitrite extrusion protein 2 n=1 Tax=Escherichia coli TaxID=562 RepID=A0A2X1KWS9_ECOLX|nr:nitrite extrusion protein 2 [Escherichia coli]
MKGGSDEQAQKEAVTETAAALGFISAIGAVGGFFIPQAFGMSLNMTGSPVGAMKVFFNLLHRLCAADLAGLWSAEVQPKIRDRCLMYNRVASDKASDPNSFLEQESCHE